MAEIVVFDIPVSQSAVGSRTAGRNVVINPKRDVLPEAPRTDDRERVWRKKVRARRESVLRDDSRRLLAVESKVPLIPECDRQVSRNLAGIHRARERFLLCL